MILKNANKNWAVKEGARVAAHRTTTAQYEIVVRANHPGEAAVRNNGKH